jgi:tetratricopeptide (TPR) repeat protein
LLARLGENANLEKAIEIKRRAQRCIQNGDLDGALAEYEKLVGFEDSDPYNFVLLADLLYKKGEHGDASERYLAAVASYEKASLYKNAIAVCKKMTRLSLSPAKVLQALASLHALDGLAGEAALYYVQYAEHMVRSSAPADAAMALRKAFDVCQDNIKVLEQLSEAWLLAGDQHQAAQALVEAANHYRQRGQESDARRCQKRASTLDASVAGVPADAGPDDDAPAVIEHAKPGRKPEPTASEAPSTNGLDLVENAQGSARPTPSKEMVIEPTAHASMMMARPDASSLRDVEGFDSGRHDSVIMERPQLGGSAKTKAKAPEAPGAAPEDFAASEAEIAAYGAVEAGEEAGGEEIEEEDADSDSTIQYVIEDEVPAPRAKVPMIEAPDDEDPNAEPVYEIAIEDAGPALEEINAEQTTEDEGVVIIEEEPAGLRAPEAASPEPVSTSAPGLSFGSPAATPAPPPVQAPAPPPVQAPASAPHGPTTQEIGLQQVEALLTQAQGQFRAGDRETASTTLARAAQAYEILGRFDSAATIYRSLGRSASVPQRVLDLWLSNCERRGDRQEAATVACEMGDRALSGGDEADARRWFERAMSFDAGNEIARRRLQRLAGGNASGPGPVALASGTPSAAGAAPMEAGRVEVAVGRGEAVTFDLSGLLAEFQRGVEAQLAGDAQSHYDLGMTYREMGLLEQAVDSFRVAVGEPRLAARALEMIGRCHAEQCRWPEAVGEFRRALAQPTPEGGDAELRYHYAHALVELGEAEAALTEYEEVARQLPGHEDVDERISALRRVLGRA